MDRARDLLIRNGHLLTMDPELGDLRGADVLVRGGRIEDVGSRLPGGDVDVLDATGCVVLPGLVDGHRHSWQSLLHLLAADWSYPRYMREIRGGYGGCFDPDDAYLANLLGGLESLAAGITTVVDHSHLQSSEEMTAALVRGSCDSGVGGWFAYAFQNAPDWTARSYDPADLAALLTGPPQARHDEGFAAARRVLDEHDPDRRGPLRLGAAFPETAPYLQLGDTAELLARIDALGPELLTGHWDAAPDGESATMLRELIDRGLMSVPTVLAHGNHLDDTALGVLADGGVGLVTTPGTELGMAMGPLVAGRVPLQGGASCLGIDTTCCCAADLIDQARTLARHLRHASDQRGGHHQFDSSREALELITLGGARATGAHGQLGSLTPGKRADIVVVDPDPVRARPFDDPASAVLFATTPHDVVAVLVAGRALKRDKRLVGVDVRQLAERAADSRRKLERRYAALPADVIANAWGDMV